MIENGLVSEEGRYDILVCLFYRSLGILVMAHGLGQLFTFIADVS